MTSQTVKCWGESWDATNVLCAGGVDPAYIHPGTGSNKRERCKYFATCAAETNARRAQRQQTQVVPAQQLIQPPMTGAPVVPTPTSTAPFMMPPPPPQWQHAQPKPVVSAPQMAYSTAAQPGAWPGMSQPQMVNPAYASMPAYVPMNLPAMGAQIPSYLTVPEPLDPKVHWAMRLFHSLLRATAKAGCHTAANFFDHYTFTPYSQPPSQAQP